jgi:hypothetical protein
MKVDFDENGCLCILAETTVEGFALQHWYDEWTKDRCTFLVMGVSRADDGSGALDTTLNSVSSNAAHQAEAERR